MSVNLNISNYFSVVAQGRSHMGKQGNATDDPKTEYPISVTGNVSDVTGQLLTATVQQVLDSLTVTQPWSYMHYWADQDSDIQLIGSSTNVILKCKALVPFVMSYDGILAAANTTPITGGATPSLQQLASIYIGNYSGSTMNYTISFVG
jgi:hypothetical protein